MPSSGLFITLYDEETLTLYLDRGVYSFLMPPVYDEVSSRSRHYHALADYACIREGTYVFFFLKRSVVYGGQAIGSTNIGSFYLNGNYSPMGRKANADLYWNESKRERYQSTNQSGIFRVPNVGERCQPYLIRFKDNLGLKGQAISSDQLYMKLGEYPYPLPSNSIQGMGFCTLSPCETDTALLLLEEESTRSFPVTSNEEIFLEGEPLSFKPEYGIKNLKKAFDEGYFVNEAHIDASAIAYPNLLPDELQPQKDATICRQVPVSPFKPYQMDRVDVCYYYEDGIADGSLPNVIIELKNKKAGKNAIKQIERYLKWLHKVLGSEAKNVDVYLLAPSFAKTAKAISPEYSNQVELVEFR